MVDAVPQANAAENRTLLGISEGFLWDIFWQRELPLAQSRHNEFPDLLNRLEGLVEGAGTHVFAGPNACSEMMSLDVVLLQHVSHCTLPVESSPCVWKSIQSVPFGHIDEDVVPVEELMFQIAVLVVAKFGLVEWRKDWQCQIVVDDGIFST